MLAIFTLRLILVQLKTIKVSTASLPLGETFCPKAQTSFYEGGRGSCDVSTELILNFPSRDVFLNLSQI